MLSNDVWTFSFPDFSHAEWVVGRILFLGLALLYVALRERAPETEPHLRFLRTLATALLFCYLYLV